MFIVAEFLTFCVAIVAFLSQGSQGNSFAVRKKDEIERVAKGNR